MAKAHDSSIKAKWLELQAQVKAGEITKSEMLKLYNEAVTALLNNQRWNEHYSAMAKSEADMLQNLSKSQNFDFIPYAFVSPSYIIISFYSHKVAPNRSGNNDNCITDEDDDRSHTIYAVEGSSSPTSQTIPDQHRVEDEDIVNDHGYAINSGQASTSQLHHAHLFPSTTAIDQLRPYEAAVFPVFDNSVHLQEFRTVDRLTEQTPASPITWDYVNRGSSVFMEWDHNTSPFDPLQQPLPYSTQAHGRLPVLSESFHVI